MTLNKTKGNMYPWVTHTWNPIKGTCPHECNYCYMKRFPQGELRLDEKALSDNLGENNFIFVGSSTDMLAEEVSKGWILKVLEHCMKYPKNKYLFQTKNPDRFWDFMAYIVLDFILGTTIETNRETPQSKAPSPYQRIQAMKSLEDYKSMISIEPIMDFDLTNLFGLIKEVEPEFVSIGADSKNHGLNEPSKEKVEALIKELKKFTKVKIKDNLERLR